MPIAPVAKGLIIVSGILITASIALYENEQVREWVETTGRKISGAWEDVVNFDQRQRQRRAQAYGAGVQQRHERGDAGQELRVRRREALRRMNEGGRDGRASGIEELDDEIPAAVLRESIEAEGLRKRKARASESQEHFLGDVPGSQDTTRRADVVVDQAEDPAISVPELDPELIDVKSASHDTGAESLESTSSFNTAKSENQLSESTPMLLDYEMPPSITQVVPQSSIDQQTRQTITHAPLSISNLSHENLENFTAHTTQTEDHQPINPFSDDHELTTPSNLTLHIPATQSNNNRARTQSSSTVSPVLVHTPTSASGSSISGGMHTPPQQEEEFEAVSDAGTETASCVSGWREEGDDIDDDMQSVASEESGISGWSEVGSEM